ncbi:unnamed protein product [Pleuronectes platessa]|uniref:Uncharacterized protein n=1 Tax=Pleuronectes platessa TaxID=8262 RepID=A0A9N7YV17_PLEPL|nr:unnamed protein product [Pleuronectes platessa]
MACAATPKVKAEDRWSTPPNCGAEVNAASRCRGNFSLTALLKFFGGKKLWDRRSEQNFDKKRVSSKRGTDACMTPEEEEEEEEAEERWQRRGGRKPEALQGPPFPDQQVQEQLPPCGCHPAELCTTVIAAAPPHPHPPSPDTQSSERPCTAPVEQMFGEGDAGLPLSVAGHLIEHDAHEHLCQMDEGPPPSGSVVN